MNDQDNIVDGEVVEEQTAVTNNAGQVDTLLSLESLIKNNISSLEKLRIELKKHREMLQDVYLNDPTYKEHEAKVKEVTKVRNATKQQLLKQPSVANITNKVKNFSSEIKERQIALSDYLHEYQRMSGVNEIETENGEVLEIVTTAKVIKKASRSRS